jgi:hypothetical protein
LQWCVIEKALPLECLLGEHVYTLAFMANHGRHMTANIDGNHSVVLGTCLAADTRGA